MPPKRRRTGGDGPGGEDIPAASALAPVAPARAPAPRAPSSRAPPPPPVPVVAPAPPPAPPHAALVATELAPEALDAFAASERAKGVVYLSRVPPYMKPIKLRHLLEKYGELGRVYLAPEDDAAYARRLKAGGNKRQLFTEAWVEFMDKHVARTTAEVLNGTPVADSAGRKSKNNFYATDLWTIKYLKHFKWHHLTEKAAYEGRVKGAKMRAQLSGARKDAEAYLAKVDEAKGVAAGQARRAAAAAAAGGAAEAATAAPPPSHVRTFRQRVAVELA